jgi:hypothetical protein
MSVFLHALLLLASVMIAYSWLSMPFGTRYAPQVVALTLLCYLVAKKLRKASFKNLLPSFASIEMPILNLGLLILIGSTGNLDSMFFPLSFLNLFFLVMACEWSVSSLAVGLVVLFHYSLTPELSPKDLANLLALPFLYVCFLFARSQYMQAKKENSLRIESETIVIDLENQESDLISFMSGFMAPKLQLIHELLREPQRNLSLIKTQLSLLNLEVHKLIQRHAPRNDQELE